MRTPRTPLVAKVSPRSVAARRAGPAVFHSAYGPVTAASETFSRGVDRRQGPNRTSSSFSPTSSHAFSDSMPKGRESAR